MNVVLFFWPRAVSSLRIQSGEASQWCSQQRIIGLGVIYQLTVRGTSPPSADVELCGKGVLGQVMFVKCAWLVGVYIRVNSKSSK